MDEAVVVHGFRRVQGLSRWKQSLVIEGLSMNGTDVEVDPRVATSGETARLAPSKPARAHKGLPSRGGGIDLP